MSISNAKLPSLKDKLEAAAKAELAKAEEEAKKVKKERSKIDK